MADIEWAEVIDSQQYVTGDMVEDAANVLANHYVACRALFTGVICCACGERSQTMKEWREHVAEIILQMRFRELARAVLDAARVAVMK